MASGTIYDTDSMAAVSTITAAWLEDTGWYTNINTTLLQEFPHGKGQGC